MSEEKKTSAREALDSMLGVLLALIIAILLVASIKWVWQDSWRLPNPFRYPNNQEVIDRVKECEEGGMRGVPVQNELGITIRVNCEVKEK